MKTLKSKNLSALEINFHTFHLHAHVGLSMKLGQKV